MPGAIGSFPILKIPDAAGAGMFLCKPMISLS